MKEDAALEKAKVYFTRKITPEAVVEMYERLGVRLPGKVAVKVHSGEKGNQNFLRPEFMKPMVEYVNGTIVECNTAYHGARNETGRHWELIAYHGWNHYFPVDIMDADGNDLELYPRGTHMKVNRVGRHMENYDSMLVLSHFKGHPMGGFGGALKQLSIGCASSAGKCLIHSAGVTDNQNELWGKTAPQEIFCECMAETAGSVVDYFSGNIAYVSMLCNLSVDCDCCAVAENPCMQDIGILSSLDPVALDQACIDLIQYSQDPGRDHFMERVNSRHGIHTIEAAADLGVGTRDYELICVDEL